MKKGRSFRFHMNRTQQVEKSLERLFPNDKDIFEKKLKEGIPEALPGYNFPLAFGTMKWLSEEVCRKLITARVMVYLSLAEKFAEKFGEEAIELIKQIRYENGYSLGERLAGYTGKRVGTIKNWDILLAGWEAAYPWSNASIAERTEKRIAIRIPRCGVGETFLALKPHLDLGIAKMYCDNDFGTFDALFGKENIKAERPKWIPECDSYCEYTIEFKGKK